MSNAGFVQKSGSVFSVQSRQTGLAVEQVGHGRDGVELEDLIGIEVQFHAPSPSIMGFLESWFTRRRGVAEGVGKRRGTEQGDSR